MGKNEVLPLVYKAVLGDVNTLFDVDETNRNIGLCEGAASQQRADLLILERDFVPKEKVKKLVEALMICHTIFGRTLSASGKITDQVRGQARIGRQTAREALAQLGEGMIAEGEKKEG